MELQANPFLPSFCFQNLQHFNEKSSTALSSRKLHLKTAQTVSFLRCAANSPKGPRLIRSLVSGVDPGTNSQRCITRLFAVCCASLSMLG